MKPDKVKEVIDLINPTRMNLGYVDPDFTKAPKLPAEDWNAQLQTLPFYGVKYRLMRALPEDVTKRPTQEAFPVAMGPAMFTANYPEWLRWLAPSVDAATVDSMVAKHLWSESHESALRLLPEGSTAPPSLMGPKPLKDVPKKIDTSFALAESGESGDTIAQLWGMKPKEIVAEPVSSLYYRQGSMSGSPKAYVKFSVKSKKRENNLS